MDTTSLFDDIDAGRLTTFELPHALVGANPNPRTQEYARRRRDAETSAGQIDAGLFEDPAQGDLFE